jgi:hypothetical protein
MTVYQMRSRCLRKKRYPSFHFAEKLIKRIAAERGVALRAYHCDCCQGVHLTKQAAQ